jgi:carboxyl-terminal processing protease
MNNAFKIVLAVLVALAIATASFAGGLYAAAAVMPKAASSPFDSIPGMTGGTGAAGATGSTGASTDPTFDSLVNETRDYITKDALVPPTETSLTANTIDGMLKSLGDPYATYFDPKHFQYFSEQTQGSFGGIGVTLGENKQGQAYVVSVIKDTPAAKAGIKKGDVFVSIDATTRPKWSSDEVVKRVRGKEGTTVVVGMKRAGVAKPLIFKLVREQIKVPNVDSSIQGGDIGYIRLFQFNANAGQDIRTAIDELKKKGAKAYILDLRDNPGGLLQSGVDVTSLFVKGGAAPAGGVVVRVDERGKPEQKYYVTGQTATDAPLVVLINANSASASEIAAGALQDYKRAILVGVKSFGKGSVQSIHQLSNGGAIKFTTAHYLTPLKRVINHKGLLPDYIVPMKEELQANPKTDVQLQKAIELLQQKVGK